MSGPRHPCMHRILRRSAHAAPAGAASAWAGAAVWARGVVLIAGLAAAGSPALAQGYDGLPPGLWNLVRSGTPQPPAAARGLQLCVDARSARDPALLVGEAPGDASCRIRTPRRTDAETVTSELECTDGRRLRAVTRFTSPEAFTTRIETLAGRPHVPDPAFVQARRVQAECVR